MTKIVIMERAEAFRKAMRTAESEPAAFNVSGDGPMHDRLRALYDNYLRAHPSLSPDACFALAWGDLSLSDRNQIRDEESGEYQEREAELARARASAMKGMDMNRVDMHALAMLALEGAAEALRKRDPDLTREQAFARALAENHDIAKIERQASRGKLMASLTPRREIDLDEPIAKRDHALDELRGLADGLRRHNPSLTPEQAFAKVYSDPANLEITRRERQASREVIFAL